MQDTQCTGIIHSLMPRPSRSASSHTKRYFFSINSPIQSFKEYIGSLVCIVPSCPFCPTLSPEFYPTMPSVPSVTFLIHPTSIIFLFHRGGWCQPDYSPIRICMSFFGLVTYIYLYCGGAYSPCGERCGEAPY